MPRRVLLKLSGESLSEQGLRGITPQALKHTADEIAQAWSPDVQLAIVVGGGNFWRGAKDHGGLIPRPTSDNMGMLATIINALALQGALEAAGRPTRVQTSIDMFRLAEPCIIRKAVRHLEKGRIVIFAGGTGNPYFTTDTCASLRASEISADVILKATQVDYVYTDDPKKNPGATPLTSITFKDAITKGLKFMDASALSMCMDNNIKVHVFNLHKSGNIKKAVQGEKLGTLVE